MGDFVFKSLIFWSQAKMCILTLQSLFFFPNPPLGLVNTNELSPPLLPPHTCIMIYTLYYIPKGVVRKIIKSAIRPN